MAYRVELYADEALKNKVDDFTDAQIETAVDTTGFEGTTAPTTYAGTLAEGPEYKVPVAANEYYSLQQVGDKLDGTKAAYYKDHRSDSESSYNVATSTSAYVNIHIIDAPKLFFDFNGGRNSAGEDHAGTPMGSLAWENDAAQADTYTDVYREGCVLIGWSTNVRAPLAAGQAQPTDGQFISYGGKVSVSRGKDGYTYAVGDATRKLSRTYDAATALHAVWQAVICKIVDNGGEHVFTTLNSAVDYARTNLDGRATIQMLVDYEIPSTDRVVLASTDDITFTTAPTTGAGLKFAPTFSRQSADSVTTAILRRGYTGDALFTSSGKLTFENITLDGNKGNYTGVNGGLVNAAAGTLTLKEKTALRNSEVTGDGGAVYLAANGSLDADGASIQGNKAQNGGGIYAEGGAARTTIKKGTLSNNEAVQDGGGFYAPHGNLLSTFENMTISGNSAGGLGGGIYHDGWNGKTSQICIVSNVSVTNNTANNGGGIYARNVTLQGGTKVTGNKTTAPLYNEKNQKVEVAAGVYVAQALILGSGAADATDATTVSDNVAQDGKASNVRLPKALNGNNQVSQRDGGRGIFIRNALTGTILVTNPGSAYSQFGYSNPHALKGVESIKSDEDEEFCGRIDPLDATGESVIWWKDPVCKVTDKEDNLLTYNDGQVAVFAYLEDAIFAYHEKTFKSMTDGDATQAKIQMLVETYELKNTLGRQNYKTYGIWGELTLTTAAKPENPGSYDYRGTDGTVCTIKNCIEGDSPMFWAQKDVIFTATRITLDNQGKESRIINGQENGAIILSKDVILQNSNSGAVFAQGGSTITMEENALIKECHAGGSGINHNGGAVYVQSGSSFEMKDDAKITDCHVTENGNYSGNGGAVYVRSYDAHTSFTMSGNAVIEKCDAEKNGGAVYIDGGSGMTLSGGTITGNTSGGDGAGIYLSQSATLELSGAPDFGGTDVYAAGDTIPEGKAVGDIKGTDGNFTTTAVSGTNGQKAYARARQDIFVAGYPNADAKSIAVTGPITSGTGSIWVWAADQTGNKAGHYKMLTQFATLSEDLLTSDKTAIDTAKITAAQLADTYLVFRNARIDKDTECGGDYLTGQEGEDIGLIYWTGGFDFAFQKIDGDGVALDGATFTLYRANATGTGILTDGDGKRVAYQAAGADVTATSSDAHKTEAVEVRYLDADGATVTRKGVYGDGLVVFEKIPPGTYFLLETDFPADADGNEYVPVGGEALYKLVLDGKGCYKMYTQGQDAAGNVVWSDEAPTRTLKLKKGTVDYEADVYTVLDLSPLEHKVALRKVDGGNKDIALPGAVFTLYYVDKQTAVRVTRSDGTVQTLKDVTSRDNGAIFVGRLPYGTYYMKETEFPAAKYAPAAGYQWFTFQVGADGLTGFEKVTDDGE